MAASPVLLDLDGTLVDSLADIAASVNHVRATFGLDAQPVGVVRRWIGDGADMLLRRALADAPASVAEEEAWSAFDAHHREQCVREVRAYPGVESRLRAWRGSGRPLAVVTNKPERFARRVLEHLGLQHWFGALIGGDSCATRKPDPAPLHEALRRLGASADDALMVGDGIQDLRAGRAAGLRTAAALYGFHDPELLRAEGADEYWVAFGVPAP